MTLTAQLLAALVPASSPADRAKYLGPLNATLAEYDISTPLRVAHFFAQIGHETINLSATVENLNYSVDAILKTFSVARVPVAQAKLLGYVKDTKGNLVQKSNPEALANLAYGGPWGLKNLGNVPGTGDGWRYRGRGAIQTTGRRNYEVTGNGLGVDLVSNPERLSEPLLWARSAGWFWRDRKLNSYADRNDIVGLRKVANGGSVGLDDVRARFVHNCRVLGLDATTGKPLPTTK